MRGNRLVGMLAAAGVALLALSACTEKPQVQAGGLKRSGDAKAWQGGVNTGYEAPGWKAGDAVSWETHMKTRTQNGQNEYTRTTSSAGAPKPQ